MSSSEMPPATSLPADGSKILQTLLDRLMVGLLNGPAMNCRPHHSRQRIDLASLSAFPDTRPLDVLRAVLSADGAAKIVVRTPKAKAAKEADGANPESPATPRHLDPLVLVTKLRRMVEDARVYKQDTGVHALALGFPLLALPPGTLGREMNRRVLAPLAFVPVEIRIARGVNTTIDIGCFGEGTDRAVPNTALFAWLDRLVGKENLTASLFEDATGTRPLREIVMLVAAAAKALELPIPAFVPEGHEQMPPDDAPDLTLPDNFQLTPAPAGDEGLAEPRILPAAVIGLFPMAKQGLINDMQWLTASGAPDGPVASFLKAGLSLAKPADAAPTRPSAPVADVALIADADPCQRGVLRTVQTHTGVVVHGPPGTGKSQTIVNLIGDHLARGQRVLFVCDKRTAIDVVLNRMTFAGLDELCAVVHDAQADQRELYRSIRAQLDALRERPAKSKPGELSQTRIDQELADLRERLTKLHHALMTPPAPGKSSFHRLVGEWFTLEQWQREGPVVALDEIERDTPSIRAAVDRAAGSGYAANAWAGHATADVSAFLARPVDEVRDAVAKVSAALAKSDGSIHPAMPAFDAAFDLATQAKARAALAPLLTRVTALPAEQRSRIADADALQRLRGRLGEVRTLLESVRATPLDPSLSMTARQLNLTTPELARQSAALQAYIESARSLLGWFAFGRKREARAVLTPLGLPRDVPSATRAKVILDGLRERLLLTYLHNELASLPAPASAGAVLSDEELLRGLDGYAAIAAALALLDAEPSLAALRGRIVESLQDESTLRELAAGLAASPARAAAIADTLTAVEASRLFSEQGTARVKADLYAGRPLTDWAARLPAGGASLESVVRVERALADLAEPLRAVVASALASGASSMDEIVLPLRRRALEAEIRARLAADPALVAHDARDRQAMQARVVELEKQRQTTIRDGILRLWRDRVASRLLSDGRPNDVAKKTEARFLLSGKNARRLRTVIQQGAADPGGDPIFDLRPVWMASPETVAQLFPRSAVFDVVIFDEASQLRLEESLPVLMRARRLVIAGDEKQLPPTRFFESTANGDGEDDPDAIPTDQQLFESQQANIEDLLSASLTLQIDEAYLDVHYRSKNADLIEFSNRYFYGSRLQALPAPPSVRSDEPPVRLIRVDGAVYAAGVNQAEAAKVVEVVRELLARKNPPSIGIACMNVQQRDAIVDALDAAADEDEAFAKRLDAARGRVGKGAFEGLFVKNLENVQGDERDHILISTTYGPDANGRFYERFGPLQQQGGGRRLNVLVTRARSQVHLVTSIPASRYAALPPVPEGSIPTGGWLLYAYLKYADELAAKYAAPIESGGRPNLAGVAGDGSTLAGAIARRLESRGVKSIVDYGNDGFRIDLAALGDGAKGVLIDTTRFTGVDDPAAWDVFRAGILAQQGWSLDRIWSPHFFRDPEGELKRIFDTPGQHV